LNFTLSVSIANGFSDLMTDISCEKLSSKKRWGCEMKVISVKIDRRTGENGAPRAGEATFSDGKTYEWQIWSAIPGIRENEEMTFYTRRVMLAGTSMRHSQLYAFHPKKRTEVLEAWLKENG
jgi:hypothetical protein